MATQETTVERPDLTQLSPDQIRELERTLTNFVTKVKEDGALPIEGLVGMMGHGSHANTAAAF